MVDITDDFTHIIISSDVYNGMCLDAIKKMGVVSDHYGIFVRIEPSENNKIGDFRVEKKYV
jgi:hypothetical protein